MAVQRTFSSDYDREKYSDVTLLLGDQAIFAHRVVLAHNPMFASLLDSTDGKRVRLDGLSPDVGRIFVGHLYGIPIPTGLEFSLLCRLLTETEEFSDRAFSEQVWRAIDVARYASAEMQAKALALESLYRETFLFSERDVRPEVIGRLPSWTVLPLVLHLKKTGSEFHWIVAFQWIAMNAPESGGPDLLAHCSFKNAARFSSAVMGKLLTFLDVPALRETVLSILRAHFVGQDVGLAKFLPDRTTLDRYRRSLIAKE